MSTLYSNIRIFDGNNVIPSGHVLTQDGHISYVGVNPPATIPDNADHIDGTDKNWTLLPGLIDAHVHAYLLPGGGSEVFKTAMKCGVTSILDMHNDPDLVNRLKKECRDSSELPDLKSSYHGATIEGGWPKPIVLLLDPSEENVKRVDQWPELTPGTAEDFIIKNKAQGADYIKLMQENGYCMSFHNLPPASLELQSALVQAAHKHGLLTVAHAMTLKETMVVLRAGVDGLAHTFCDQSPTPELIALYKSTGAFVIPTLCAIATINDAERDTTLAFAHDSRITSRKAISAQEISWMSSSQNLNVVGTSVEHAYESIIALKAAGVDIVAGTDTVPGLQGTTMGLSLVMELWLYVKRCGFTPVEALRAATGTTARRFGMADRGVIEQGRRADLIVVRGNVVEDGADLRGLLDLVGVWKEGVKCPGIK